MNMTKQQSAAFTVRLLHKAMKALIHIGMPKTGSTTIQRFLQTNRAALRGDGVFYRRYLSRPGQPEFVLAVENAAGHLVANRRIRGSLRLQTLDRQRDRAAAFEKQLEQDIASSGCPRFIASSEYLGSSGRSADFIGALDRWMCGRFADVRYLVYLRRQEDWLVSRYSQYVSAGGEQPLGAFIAGRSLPDLDAYVAKWESALGVERLDVRLMDRARLANRDLLTDFCDAADLDVGRLKRCESSNERLGERHATLLRRFNGAIGGRLRSETPRWALGKLARGVVSLIPPGSTGLSIDAATKEAIRNACLDSNERLRARRFPHLDALFS